MSHATTPRQVDFLIVGGGVAGLVAALTAAQQGCTYCLVEASDRLGGLLKTERYGEHSFDYGTHLIAETGDPGLDDLIIAPLRNSDWHAYETLKSGLYYRGYDDESPVPDARRLFSPADYARGVTELLDTLGAIPDTQPDTAQLKTQLETLFGPTFAQGFFIPACEKLFLTPTEQLNPNAHHLYGMSRIRISTPQASRILKQLPDLDARIAFHSNQEGAVGRARFYPRQGGIEQWIDTLRAKLDPDALHTNTTLTELNQDNGQWHATLSDGSRVVARELAWSLPAIALLKMAGLAHETRGRPNFLSTRLYHFVVDQAPLASVHYCNNLDPNFRSFRTTLYSNMAPNGDHHRVTVEVLYRGEPGIDSHGVFKELSATGLFAADARCLFSAEDNIPTSFPILTRQFMADCAYYRATLEANQSISLLGKARGDLFFTREVVLDAYRRILSRT